MEKKLYLMPAIQVMKIQGNCTIMSQSGGIDNGDPNQANPGDVAPGFDPSEGGDSRSAGGWFDDED